MAGECSTKGEKRNMYRVLVGKQERKRPLGKRGRRLDDRIKIYPREISWGSMDCIPLAQGIDQWRALMNTGMKLQFP
jgi:hypothetical protein